MNSVLIVDDREGMRRSLEIVLQKEGLSVATAAEGRTALAVLQDVQPDVVVTDLRMEPLSGIEVLQRVKEYAPQTEVIMMTAYGTVDSAVMAMKLGAFDYITKPFKNAEIVDKIRRALDKKQREAASAHAPGAAATPYGMEKIVGRSNAMQAIQARIEQVAQTDLTVLITGETGTGKTALARAIHGESARASGKFITVNCAAVPDQLLESELFGHEKGAFTGAVKRRTGLFQEADKGTLLLDEIGAMSFALQAKLLGVLQDREVRRVGTNRPQSVDIRIITATNAELEAAVANGEFRKDLYYRVKVAHFHLPPLRERRADIPDLIAHFLARYSQADGRAYHIDDEAMGLLCRHNYPGNVRELENALAWAVAVAREGLIGASNLPDMLQAGAAQSAGATPGEAGTLQERERLAILDTLDLHDGNLTRTAKALGINRTTLWRKIRAYGIKLPF